MSDKLSLNTLLAPLDQFNPETRWCGTISTYRLKCLKNSEWLSVMLINHRPAGEKTRLRQVVQRSHEPRRHVGRTTKLKKAVGCSVKSIALLNSNQQRAASCGPA